jgi:hypothetical protein
MQFALPPTVSDWLFSGLAQARDRVLRYKRETKLRILREECEGNDQVLDHLMVQLLYFQLDHPESQVPRDPKTGQVKASAESLRHPG